MPGLREALEGAYEEIDGDDGGAGVAGGVDQPDEPVSGAAEEVGGDGLEAGSTDSERPRDPETGKFVGKPAQATRAESAAPAPVAGQGAAAGAAHPPVPAAAPAFKAPQSWKANLREQHWGTLPPEVQQEVLRREKEITQALQARAEAEKGSGAWSEVVRPYEAQIRAAGAEPQKYVGELLQTAHALNYGDPQSKADLLANLIMQFRVPPEVLDRALAARMGGQFRDPRLDNFFAQQEAQRAEEASAQAEAFAASHEYIGDVGEEMAAILDAWDKAGKKHVTEADLDRAYRMACAGNEDVMQAMEYKKAQRAAQTAQAATARARVASSSVRSQPTAGTSAQPAGRRAALEAAFDELAG